MRHELKTHPGPFNAVWNGLKTHEFRSDDRRYEVGDRLVLREWDPTCIWHGPTCDLRDDRCEPKGYLGRVIDVDVSYITRGPDFGVPRGYVAMSIVKRARHGPAVRDFCNVVCKWCFG